MSANGGLGDAQAHAIVAAAEVFEGLAGELGASGPGAPAAPDRDDPVGRQRLRTAGAQLIDVVAGIVQEAVEGWLELAQELAWAGGDDGHERHGLSLRGAPGERVATSVWMHSAEGAGTATVVLRLSPLHAASGGRIDGAPAVFLPDTLRLGDGASASSLLTVEIPRSADPGLYFGHVLIGGAADDGLPLRLSVEGRMIEAFGHAEVERTLARYATIVQDAIDVVLSEERPAPYLSGLVDDYPTRRGKGIRSALLLGTCQAFGGSVRDALAPAVAIELLHNAFLVHDDVEDGSSVRRGRPTLHELHGSALAVNAGDALAIVALRGLRDHGVLGARVSRRLYDELLEMLRMTAEGQALELGWRRDNVVDVTVTDYLTLVAKKTCCYTTVAPLRLGALAGSRGTASLAGLTRFGFFLGAAFQMRDDLLSIVGVSAVHGKLELDDLREGKRTLMLLHVLRVASPEERAWLVAYLGSPETARSAGDVERVLALMVRHGSVAYAEELAAAIDLAATAMLNAALAAVPDSPHVAFIRGLVPYMLTRSG